MSKIPFFYLNHNMIMIFLKQVLFRRFRHGCHPAAQGLFIGMGRVSAPGQKAGMSTMPLSDRVLVP
jgi:hypothetical protein